MVSYEVQVDQKRRKKAVKSMHLTTAAPRRGGLITAMAPRRAEVVEHYSGDIFDSLDHRPPFEYGACSG